MDDICEPRSRASPELGHKKTPLTHCQGRERPCRFVVPPCFTRPSRGRALPGTDIPWRCDGHSRRGLGQPCPSPTRLRGHVRRGLSYPFSAPRALCAVSPRLLFPSLPLKTYSLAWLMVFSLARQSVFVNGAILPEWEGTKRVFLSPPTKFSGVTWPRGSASPFGPAGSGPGAPLCGSWRW